MLLWCTYIYLNAVHEECWSNPIVGYFCAHCEEGGRVAAAQSAFLLEVASVHTEEKEERPWCNQMWIQGSGTRHTKASFTKSKIVKSSEQAEKTQK